MGFEIHSKLSSTHPPHPLHTLLCCLSNLHVACNLVKQTQCNKFCLQSNIISDNQLDCEVWPHWLLMHHNLCFEPSVELWGLKKLQQGFKPETEQKKSHELFCKLPVIPTVTKWSLSYKVESCYLPYSLKIIFSQNHTVCPLYPRKLILACLKNLWLVSTQRNLAYVLCSLLKKN
jgi:hypothetical protein